MDAGDVLRRFGVHADRVRRLPRGAVNELWVVDAGRDRFVLKRTHVERLPVHTRREHEVLAALRDRGWSVPEPVAADDGDTLVRIDERTWWLARWLPGRAPVVSASAATRLGTVLARLHGDLEPLPSLGADETWGVRSIMAREVPRHGWRFVEALAALQAADEARGRRLRLEIDRVTAALDALPVGPSVQGHGDLHCGNLLVHRGTVSVLDFDFSHPMERAEDLAASLALLDDQRLAPAVARGYESVTPLGDDERAALPLLFDARLLQHASWVTFQWSQGAVAPSHLDSTFDRLGTCGL